MKKLIVAASTAALLSLAACGGNSATENTVVTNDVELNTDDAAIDGNLTAIDEPVLDNGADANLTLDNAADGNAL